MTDTDPRVEISVAGDDVLVTGEAILFDRRLRLFFRSVLGALPIENGWRCPRRHGSMASLVVRINTFLEARGLSVTRYGVADQEVERELERRRSFARTLETAASWKSGTTVMDLDDVKRRLSEFGWTGRILRPHQELGLAHGLAAVNAANFSVPGSGKTATALAVAASHLAAGTIDLVLVIGPLSCFRPWEQETALALGARVPTRRIRGHAQYRRTAYASAQPGSLLLLSFATAAADRLPLTEMCRAHNVMLIVDESHRAKRFQGGLWAPALVEIASHARVRMILSGTPMPQSGRDLYSQLKILWPSGELTGPRDAFAARVERDFESVLRTVHPFMSRTPKDALGLPSYDVTRHEVPLLATQAEIYDLVLSGFKRRIEDAETWADKIEALRRGRPIRLLQAAANPDLLNRGDSYYRIPRVNAATPTLLDRLATYAEHETPGKSEAALEILAEIASRGGKTVCWSTFIGNLDHFANLVRSRLGLECFQIDGRVPTGDEPVNDQMARRSNPQDIDTRERIIDRFLGSQGPAVLVANPASCSESISLHQSCHHAIYLDRTYDCAQFLQSIDRIHRLGLPPTVTVQIHILLATVNTSPTVDHLVDASLVAKEAVMRELLEGAELRPLAQSADPADDAEGTEQDLAALLRYLLGEEQSR